jgi:hypothetical protein
MLLMVLCMWQISGCMRQKKNTTVQKEETEEDTGKKDPEKTAQNKAAGR